MTHPTRKTPPQLPDRGRAPGEDQPHAGGQLSVLRQIARREARNFYLAFRLLPGEPKRSMCALYAFMRHTDDLADGALAAAEKRAH